MRQKNTLEIVWVFWNLKAFAHWDTMSTKATFTNSVQIVLPTWDQYSNKQPYVGHLHSNHIQTSFKFPFRSIIILWVCSTQVYLRGEESVRDRAGKNFGISILKRHFNFVLNCDVCVCSSNNKKVSLTKVESSPSISRKVEGNWTLWPLSIMTIGGSTIGPIVCSAGAFWPSLEYQMWQFLQMRRSPAQSRSP